VKFSHVKSKPPEICTRDGVRLLGENHSFEMAPKLFGILDLRIRLERQSA